MPGQDFPRCLTNPCDFILSVISFSSNFSEGWASGADTIVTVLLTLITSTKLPPCPRVADGTLEAVTSHSCIISWLLLGKNLQHQIRCYHTLQTAASFQNHTCLASQEGKRAISLFCAHFLNHCHCCLLFGPSSCTSLHPGFLLPFSYSPYCDCSSLACPNKPHLLLLPTLLFPSSYNLESARCAEWEQRRTKDSNPCSSPALGHIGPDKKTACPLWLDPCRPCCLSSYIPAALSAACIWGCRYSKWKSHILVLTVCAFLLQCFSYERSRSLHE